MRPFRSLLAALATIVLPICAHAQTLTFTAATTTGTSSVVPDLTWATTPAATACAASGAANWTGAKGPAGNQVLPAITVDASYTLTCDWPADDKAVLTWVNPTQNENGTAYTNPQDLWIKYRYGAGAMDGTTPCTPPVTCVVVTPPTTTTRTITGFTTAGTVNFALMARNTAGAVSLPASASKTFVATAPVTRSVQITVNPRPNGASSFTVQ